MGPEYDLANPLNVTRLKRICLGAHFVHFGPPCSSFSMARRGQAPRSRAFPMGKPQLSAADQARVSMGNRLMMVCIRLIRLLHDRGILWSLEQPQTSRMWICPPMIRLVKQINARRVVTCFCGWGKPWRKATTFAYSHRLNMSQIARSCNSKSGICEFRQTRHQVLEGSGPKGVSWTLIAQPYPRPLCSAIARTITRHHVYAFINRLDRRGTVQLKAHSHAVATRGESAASPPPHPVHSPTTPP